MKISSTPMQSEASLVFISTADEKFDIISRWLPTVTTSTKMVSSQSGPFLKLPISIEKDSLRYGTSGLADIGATLSFVSRECLN